MIQGVLQRLESSPLSLSSDSSAEFAVNTCTDCKSVLISGKFHCACCHAPVCANCKAYKEYVSETCPQPQCGAFQCFYCFRFGRSIVSAEKTAGRVKCIALKKKDQCHYQVRTCTICHHMFCAQCFPFEWLPNHECVV
jgi:hypothetical protein